jgi:hypothetical protein
MTQLPYKVQCKSTRQFYELIAAFDCEVAAIRYAGECALANVTNSYRVKRGYGNAVIQQFGPEA